MMIRQRVLALGAMLLLTVALTSAANAQQAGLIEDRSTDVENPAPITIPQFNPDPTNDNDPTISTVTITAAEVGLIDNGGTITDAFFTIDGLQHDRVSDLTVRINYFPLGTDTSTANPTRTATLFERVGITDAGTDAGGNGTVDNQNIDGFGAISNFNGAYRFQNGGESLFATATALEDEDVVPTLNSAGDDSQLVFAATGANNGQVNLLMAFGTDGAGNALTLPQIIGIYEFAISDRSNFISTTVSQPADANQSFTATNVSFQAAVSTPAIPEPSTATSMLLALIGLATRRRRS